MMRTVLPPVVGPKPGRAPRSVGVDRMEGRVRPGSRFADMDFSCT
jgi:hypothetical protein